MEESEVFNLIYDYCVKTYQCVAIIYEKRESTVEMGLTTNCGQSKIVSVDISNKESIRKSIDRAYKEVSEQPLINDQFIKQIMKWLAIINKNNEHK
ncbi:MAG: hypothetical protein ABF608_07035 [Sporolactobacillus sp.]